MYFEQYYAFLYISVILSSPLDALPRHCFLVFSSMISTPFDIQKLIEAYLQTSYEAKWLFVPINIGIDSSGLDLRLLENNANSWAYPTYGTLSLRNSPKMKSNKEIDCRRRIGRTINNVMAKGGQWMETGSLSRAS